LIDKNISSACWQGYDSNWVIEDSCLFLKDIYSSFGVNWFTRRTGQFTSTKILTRKVARITGGKYKDDALFAYWYTDTIWYSGKSIKVDTSRSSISWMFPYLDYVSLENTGLVFKNGKLIKTLSVRYKPCKETIVNYHDFIYSKINWDSIPKSNLIFDIINLKFEFNESGELTYCDAICKNEKAYEREIERIVQSTPCFDVYYRGGEFCCNKITLNIKISEGIRKRYNGSN